MIGNRWFHQDNAPVHTSAVVTNRMVARRFQIIEHPPYLPALVPADFFLFPSVTRELVGRTLTQETLKKEREGAVRTLSAADFAMTFKQQYERCGKCVNIAGGYMLRKAKSTKCYALSIKCLTLHKIHTFFSSRLAVNPT